MKRLLIVLYFVITIPIWIAWINEFDKDYLRDHAYYFSTNKVKEEAQILRETYKLVPEDRSEIIKLWDKEIIDFFLEKNPHWENRFNYHIKWYDTSRNLVNGLFWIVNENFNKNYKADMLKSHYWIYLLYMIWINLLMIIGYILFTDLLCKTGGYIINWKFKWWINYVKVFNSIRKKLSKHKH